MMSLSILFLAGLVLLVAIAVLVFVFWRPDK
jgi:hypothetical protein